MSDETETETEEVTPALFDHAKRLYEAMKERSHVEEVEIGDGSGGDHGEPQAQEIQVYEGHLTRLFSELALPNPYYTKIIAALKGQNCIEQIRRGGGVALSRWMLVMPPSEEGFKQIVERRRPTKGKQAVLEQRVKDLTKVYADLCERVEVLEKRGA